MANLNFLMNLLFGINLLLIAVNHVHADAPKRASFRASPRSVTIHPGHKAQFICGSGDLEGEQKLQWSKKGSDISQSRHIVVGNGSLLITNATQADSGEYICTDLRSSTSVHLTVSDPDVTLSVTIVGAFENDPVDIRCDFEGENITVSWHKIEGELPEGSKITRRTLRIPALAFQDAGLYECRPSNSVAGGPQILTKVVVLPDPKVSAIVMSDNSTVAK